MRIGAVNPNVFQDDAYKLGSSATPTRRFGDKALDAHRWSAWRSPPSWARPRSLWFADGTNYAGQDSLRGRKRRC